MLLIEYVLFFVGLLVGVAWRLSVWFWVPGFLCYLLMFSIFSHLSVLFMSICWAVFFALTITFAIPKFRRKWLFHPLLKKITKAFPAMGQTERDAIDAGDVWWEAQLFSGKPNWQTLLNEPQATLTDEEQAFLDNQVAELSHMLDDWQATQDKDLPQPVWDFLKREKFFGMVIPREYGGLGFSAFAHSSVIMRLGTRSAAASITAMVPNSLGPGELLVRYGNEQQKQHYLPRLASGDEIPCFALTSMDAGSDAGSMTDYGEVCRGMHEGKEVLGIKLNWNKRYITLAPVATVLGLAFRLYDPNHLLGDEEEVGITVCLLPTSHPGVEVGNRHYPMGVPFMNGPTRGKDVFIPMEWVIGGQQQVGHGWRMLMECLSAGRGISLPAVSTAAAKLMYQTTGAYARIRRQFKLPISQFEGVQSELADIAGKTYMLQAMRLFVASAVDQGKHPAIASAIAKYHMTEMARDVINKSMDVHGGKAVQIGPNNYTFPAYISNPIGITVEGANILTRNLIIFGQGVVRCHPYLLDEMNIIEQGGADQLKKFDQVVMPHLGYTFSNIAKCILYGFTGGKLNFSKIDKRIRKYTKQLSRMSSILALLTDVSLFILGGRLKRKEALSARLGDILSHLFIASAVLKYYADNGYPKHESNHVHWCMRYSLWKMQEAIVGVLDNFPVKAIAVALRFVIFPYGRRYLPPSDRLNHNVVKPMLEFSKIRESLSAGCAYQKSENDPVGVLELALEKALKSSPLEKRLQNAKLDGELPSYGSFEKLIDAACKKAIIDEDEASLLREYECLRKKVLMVDEFDFGLTSVVAKATDAK